MGATHNYKNSRAAKLAIYELGEDIKAGKLPAHFGPLSFVFSGSGNVSQVGYASKFALHVSHCLFWCSVAHWDILWVAWNFFKSCHNNVEIRYNNVQGGTGRFHRQGNELTLWYLYFYPLIYSMGCATENNQYQNRRVVYVFRMHSVRSVYDLKIFRVLKRCSRNFHTSMLSQMNWRKLFRALVWKIKNRWINKMNK